MNAGETGNSLSVSLISTPMACPARIEPLPASRLPRFVLLLPPRLGKTDAGGHGNVEARNGSQHRDARELVAVLARQAAHAFPFGAEHPPDRARQAHRVEIGF